MSGVRGTWVAPSIRQVPLPGSSVFLLLGEPAIAVIDSVAGMQRGYLDWLGTLSGQWSGVSSE